MISLLLGGRPFGTVLLGLACIAMPASADGDGKAVLAKVPARSYFVRVWHSQLEATEESTRQGIDASA